MIDVSKQIYSTLNPIIPTSYEFQLNDLTDASGKLLLPCCTYIESGDYETKKSENLGYSYISMQIKIYASTVADLNKYSQKVDHALRGIGYTRNSSYDCVVDTQLQRWFTYKGLAVEYYEETNI